MEAFEVSKPVIPDCEPWHDYEKSKNEKDLIGIYLTSHPLDLYKLEMKMLCTPLDELNAGLENFKGKASSRRNGWGRPRTARISGY